RKRADYPSTMIFSLFVLSTVFDLSYAGAPTLVPNCTDEAGLFTDNAVNCDDIMAASYCGIAAAKHFYLADTTYLPAKKGADAKVSRIVQCYSGADVTAADATPDPAFIAAAVATCPKTCGFCCMTPKYNCKNADDPSINCANVTPEMCKDSKWRDTIAVNCPSKCGFCLDGGCVDAAIDCDKDPNVCKKPAMATFAKANCKRTCGFCTNTTSTTGTGTCGDNHPNCKNWIANGFCKSNGYTQIQKQQYCGKSCGLC
ncbi:hypothetical protein PENTCL1PPCAC_17238, partial [Pristionchus entomophagus]